MAQILPRDLPAAISVNTESAIIIDDGSGVKKATPAQLVSSGFPVASQAEAEAGIVSDKAMTPQRVSQAIDALGVSQVVLASTAGAAQVGYTAPGTGSIDERIADMLDKAVWLDSKGADVSGTELSILPVLRALETGRPIAIPSGIFNLGEATGGQIIDLSDYGEGITFLSMGDVEFRCNSTVDDITGMFALGGAGNTGFRAGKMRFRDMGYDPLKTWRGAVGFNLIGGYSEWGDVQIDGIYGKDLVACMTVTNGHATNRVRGIEIGQIYSDNCYYGFNAQNQGDGVKIGQLIAYQNYRPYFVYGVTDHEVKIFNRKNRDTSGAVNIARFAGGYDTTGIKVKYVARDQDQDFPHVLIDHLDLAGGKISNIDIDVDIESSVNYDPVRFVNYNSGSESSSASSNEVSNIKLRGTCDAQARDVSVTASYASKSQITFERGKNFRPAQSVLNTFYLNQVVRGTAVTWTGASSNPSLGNGTLTYNADYVGGMCHVSLSLVFGSTTTSGTGYWTFTIPDIPKANAVGALWVLDSGTGYKTGSAIMDSGSGDIKCYTDGGTVQFGPSTPITWSTGDTLRLSISFPVS